MQIKFRDNTCGAQGPKLRQILSNTSTSGIEHSLSKPAGDIRLSSAVGWEGVGERDSDRLQECAGNPQGPGPAPGWGQCPVSEQAGCMESSAAEKSDNSAR